MVRGEPTFVPEWYKGPNISATGSGNSNHQSRPSLQSDEHIFGFPSRNRLTVSLFDYDARRSLSFSEKTSSSFRRSASSNGYIGREKDISSRSYNSFGRSHHDRDRDREKDPGNHDRDRPLLPDNGFGDYPDVLISSKSEKDSLSRSQSMLSGRWSDSWMKRSGHDSSNDLQSAGDKISGINKSSFEREFPSLGVEEKHVGSDVTSVSSPGLNIAIHNLPATVSTIIRADGWTSALAEVPPIVGENGLIVSSALKTRPTLAPTASCTSTCLNMAETVALAPARARTAPQVPDNSQKIEELHRQQILKLRPMTPSMPKNLGLNLAEKSKTKGTKMVEYSALKMGQHSSSQPVNHTFHAIIKSDVPKTSQPGNFQVLNREKSGVSPTDKDNSHPRNDKRVPSGMPTTVIPHLKGQVNKKLNVDGRVSAVASTSFGEKKPASQTQNRNDFFNSLRKKTSSRQENTNQDPSCNVSAPNLDKVDEEVAVDAASDKELQVFSLMSTLQCSAEDGNCSESFEAVEEPERLVPDEEAAFLRSLGWEENAGEEALTHEEIESFLSQYEKRMPASKLKMAGCSAKMSSSCDCDAEVEASFFC